jgi:hypothetical protein
MHCLCVELTVCGVCERPEDKGTHRTDGHTTYLIPEIFKLFLSKRPIDCQERCEGYTWQTTGQRLKYTIYKNGMRFCCAFREQHKHRGSGGTAAERRHLVNPLPSFLQQHESGRHDRTAQPTERLGEPRLLALVTHRGFIDAKGVKRHSCKEFTVVAPPKKRKKCQAAERTEDRATEGPLRGYSLEDGPVG